MLRSMMMIAALVAMPVAASAQTVTIKRGEAVTMLMGDDDALHIADVEATTPTAFEAKTAAEFQRGDYAAAIGASSLLMGTDSGAGAMAPMPARSKLVLRFTKSPSKDNSMLSIQNGLGRAFAYRATMVIDGKRQTTDVCLVPPGKVVNEYWPHPIDSLELSNFRLVPWSEGNRVVCE